MTQTSVLALDEHVEERERVARAARVVRSLCAVIACSCVAIAGGLLLPNLNEQRQALELVYKEYMFQDVPPSVSLPSPMLATFRGLLIHLMWPRAEELKQEAKYYELQQLSDWICNLMPRFPKAWEYSAWNMSYNISVGTYSPRERWHWVYAGAKLLRDRGLVYNPKTINLYNQLAWIFLHKMGDFMDDYHWYYKRMWATMMERVLGQPPPEGTTAEVLGAFEPIAQAAEQIERFGALGNPDALGQYIEHDERVPSMADVVRRLQALDLEPDAAFLEKVARYERRGLQLRDLLLEQPRIEGGSRSGTAESFEVLMSDDKLAAARERLVAAVRAHVLAAQYKMDPKYMYEVMTMHGPLDWRNVYSHAYYWAALGSKRCQGVVGIDENVEMNTDRFVQFGLKDSFQRGRLVFEPDVDDPGASYIQLLPDTRFIDVLHKLYLEHAEKHVDADQVDRYFAEGPAGRLFAPGHVNFLHTAIRTLYFEGDIEKAQEYYKYCRENYTELDGKPKAQYLVPLREFAFQGVWDDVESFRRAPLMIDTWLQRGFSDLAQGRPRAATRQIALARLALDRYMEDKRLDRVERRKLPPWEEYVSGSFERFILNYTFLPLYMRARAWHLIDNDVKLAIYRNIETRVSELCAAHDPPLDAAKAFPPPPGLDAYERGRPPDKQDNQPGDKPRIKDADVSEGQKR